MPYVWGLLNYVKNPQFKHYLYDKILSATECHNATYFNLLAHLTVEMGDICALVFYFRTALVGHMSPAQPPSVTLYVHGLLTRQASFFKVRVRSGSGPFSKLPEPDLIFSDLFRALWGNAQIVQLKITNFIQTTPLEK